MYRLCWRALHPVHAARLAVMSRRSWHQGMCMQGVASVCRTGLLPICTAWQLEGLNLV